MKKRFCVIFLIFINIILCGCWGHTDLNELNILSGYGFDLDENNKFSIIVEGISPTKPKEDLSSNSESNYFSAMGKSIFDAARNLTKDSIGRRSYYQTAQVVVMGKKLCDTTIVPVMDFITRDPKRRSTVYPVIVEGYAKDFFIKHNPIEPLGSEIKNIINLYKYTGYAVDMNIAQTISTSQGITRTVLINKFKLSPSNKDKKVYQCVLDGTGVFSENKLIGYFNSKETMVANIISNKVKNVVMVIDNNQKEKSIRNITIELSDFKTKLKPTIKNDKYIINVDIKAKAEIVEYTQEQSLKDYDYNKLEKLISDNLKGMINETNLKCKTELKADALGFGNYFARKYKHVYKMKPDQWNDIYCNELDVIINVKANIRNSGATIEKSK